MLISYQPLSRAFSFFEIYILYVLMYLESGVSKQELVTKYPSFDDYKNRIEITNPSIIYPSIEVSQTTRDVFPDFINSIEEAGKNNKPITFAVVRCWNKDENSVSEFLDRVNSLKDSMPSLRGVILSINHDQDRNDITENSLVLACRQKKPEVPILPLRIKGYSWTSGLNVGVALMKEIAEEKQIDTEAIKMLNMSFDVVLEKSEIDKMRSFSETQKYLFTVRKTSEDKPPFELTSKNLWYKFKTVLREPLNSNLFELVYAARNTFNLIPLIDLIDLGGFNPLCDGKERPLKNAKSGSKPENPTFSIKGMEDSEFFMRLFLNALKTGKIETIKLFKKSFENPVLYSDPSWQRIGEIDRFKKISNETDALNKIVNNLAQSINGSRAVRIPENLQDFKI